MFCMPWGSVLRNAMLMTSQYGPIDPCAVIADNVPNAVTAGGE